MNCERVEKLLQDYVTRELPAAQRHEMDEHLMECEECRRELAVMSTLVSSLESQPVSQPAPGFTARVLAVLPEHRQPTLNPWWSLALIPLLGGTAYLLKSRLVRVLAWLYDRTGLADVRVPDLRIPVSPELSSVQLALVPVVFTLLVVAGSVGAAVLVWRRYSAGT